MEFVTNLNKGILGKADSTELWSEIISALPDELFLRKNLKILSPSCGHAVEANLIVSRMIKLGVTPAEIKDSIYLVDKYKVFTNEVTRKGYTNVIQADFLNWETNMKFDLVIGNPPYQKAAEHGKKVNDNLWAPFTFKSWELVKDGGFIAFITPDGWRTQTNDYRTKGLSVLKEIIKPYRTEVINLNEAERHFNVGSTISYFVVKKELDTTNHTKVISTFGTNYVNLVRFPAIPRDTSQIGLSIFTKVMSSKEPKWCFTQKQTKLNKSLEVVAAADSKHKVPFMDSHGSAELKYCDKQGENHNDCKVMLTYVGKYKVMVDDGKITPAQHVHRQVIDKTEMQGALSQLSSKLYRMLIEGNRSNQYIEKHIPNMMPQLDLQHNWTDADIYNHFKFTQAEIDYIEKYN